MKLRVSFLFTFLAIFIIGYSQNYPDQIDYFFAKSIIKDTLWIKEKAWRIAKYLKPNTDPVNPIYSINDSIDAKRFDFEIIPFLKVSKAGVNYKFEDNIWNILEPDTTQYSSFILFDGEIVGFLSAFYKMGKWYDYPLEIFENNNPKKPAYEKILKQKPSLIFSIRNIINGLWYLKGDSVMVYSLYTGEIQRPEDYINQRVGIENIRNWAKY